MQSLKALFSIPKRRQSAWLPAGCLALFAWLGLAASGLQVFGQTNVTSDTAEIISGIYGSVTNSNDEVISSNQCPTFTIAGFQPYATLWYQWTAPQNGEVEMDTIGSATDLPPTNQPLDTILAVYVGSSGSPCTLDQVAANDDFWPLTTDQPVIYNADSTALDYAYVLPFTGPSGLRFNAKVGTTYYIAVDTKPGQSGNIILSWAYHPSGVFRIATEEFDTRGINTNPFPAGLQQSTFSWIGGAYTPLLQTSAAESEGEWSATMDHTYYVFQPAGLLVSVTRVGGAYGRALVNLDTMDLGFTNEVETTTNGTTTNTISYSFMNEGDVAGAEGWDYEPVHTTLVFDDFEMTKTVLIPILPFGSQNPLWQPYEETNFPYFGGFSNRAFAIVLSEPTNAPEESPDVAPARVDPFFGAAYVRVLDPNIDPGSRFNNNYTEITTNLMTNAMTTNVTTNITVSWSYPTNVIINFGKRHYLVPRDEGGNIALRLFRFGTNAASMNLFYRVDNYPSTAANPPNDGDNNDFPLSPESEYAAPTSPDIGIPSAFNPDFAFVNPAPNGGSPTSFTFPANMGYYDLEFTVTNYALTEFNKDFQVSIFAEDSNGNPYPVGTINQCTITILFEDTNAPAGSVDEFYNADYGLDMEPPVETSPPQVTNPGADAQVSALVVQSADDKTIIAGQFANYDLTPINGLARINTDGTLDTSFNVGNGVNGPINAMLMTTSGQVLIAGEFTSYNNEPSAGMARLNSDGSWDSSFSVPVPGVDGAIWAIALQTNGEVFIAGDFLNVGGYYRPHIALLNTNGTVDTSFNLGTNAPNNSVFALAATNGQVILGGAFTQLGSQSANYLVRLNASGSVDTNFLINLGSGMDNTVWTLAFQTNGQFLAGGDFQTANLVSRPRIARFKANGVLDTTFQPGTGADDTVYSLAPQPDGTIYVGGLFTLYNGTHRYGFARIYGDGTLDTSFLDSSYNQFAGLHRLYYDKQIPGDPRPFVDAIGVQSDGNVMVGGSFNRVGGGQVDGNLRIDSDFPTNAAPSYAPEDFYNSSVYYQPKSRDGFRNRENVARLLGGSTPGPGNIMLLYSNYTVNAQQTYLYTALRRTNGTLGILSANFAIAPGLAQSGVDYAYSSVPPIYLYSWDNTRMRSDGFYGTNGVVYDIFGRKIYGYTADAAIVSLLGNPAGGNRDTQFQLSNPAYEDQFLLGGANIPLGGALGASVAPFTIQNDIQPTNYLGFATSNFYVNESGTNALITLVRTNTTVGACSVKVSTSNGTGKAGVNYVGLTNLSVTFLPGVTTQTFLVQILNYNVSTPSGWTVNLQLSGISGAAYGLASAVLNIVDNNGSPGTVNFSSATYGTNVTSPAVVLELTRSGADSGTLQVQCATTNGTAFTPTNYLGLTNTVVWNNLDFTPKYVTVALTNNGLVGPNLKFYANLVKSTLAVNTTNDPAALGSISNTTVTISNNNSYGTLEFSSTNYVFDEDAGLATITVVRTSGLAQNLSVLCYTADGTATHPQNYIGTTNTLTFAPGVVSQTFTVPIVENGETNFPVSDFWFTVNLASPNPSGVLGYPTTAKVYILDSLIYNLPAGAPDTTFIPNPGLDGDVYSVAMNSSGGMVVGGNFTHANGALRGKIALFNPDATLNTTFMANFPGANGPVNSVVVQSDGQILAAGSFSTMDGVVAGNLVRLNTDGSLDTTFAPGSGADSAIYAMAETFVNGSREILIGGNFINVNGTSHPGLARLNELGSVDPTFNPSLTVNGPVYAIAAYATNTIEAGKIMIGGSFTAVNGVTCSNIARINPDGTLDASFATGTGASGTVRALALQADGRVVVGGSFTNFNGTNCNYLTRLNVDGSLDDTFCVNTNGALGPDGIVYSVAVQPDQRILVAGAFLHANGVTRNRITRLLADGTVDPDINFGYGADSAIYTVGLESTPLVNDGMIVIGGDFENVNQLPRPHLARLYGGAITGSGSLQFTSGLFTADETATNALITVQRVGGTENDITVTFSTSPSNAVPGVNYQTVTTNLTFPVGETFQSVQVPVLNNQQLSPPIYWVNLALSSPTFPAALGNQPIAELEIINDNSAISFAQTSYETFQNVFGGKFLVQIQRQGSVEETSTVLFSTTTNGTAVPNLDYTPITNELVTFDAGASNAAVAIDILNNPQAVNNVTVGLQLTNTSYSLLYSPSSAELVIVSTNQSAGQVTFAQTNTSILANPAGTNVIVTVLRTNGSAGTIAVNYTTQDGSATAGYRYTATSGTLNFGPGVTSQTISIPILQLNQVTGNENFFVNLSTNSTSATTIFGPTNTTVTILDDNVGVHFYTGQEGGNQPGTNIYSVLANAGTVTLQVERVGTNGVTTVSYATTNGTAQSNLNYIAASGSLTFTNGESLKTFQVPILHDTNITGNLTFLVNLFNVSPSPAQLFAPTVAEVIIQDVNPAVLFTNANFFTYKGATNVLISVLRSNANSGTISVNYATTNGTALAGVDYVATSGTLTFSNGIVLQSFPVSIINNQLVESNVSFNISLFNPSPSNTALLPPSVATVVITNTLTGFSFDSPSYSVDENGVSRTINVLRTGYTNSTVSVNYATVDGTGKAYQNYEPASGTLEFTNGQTEESFTVTVIDAGVSAGNNTVLLQLSNPQGNAVLVSPSAATLNILDTDGELIVPCGTALLSGPANGVLGTNQQVTMLFGLRDAAGLNATNLMASLLVSNGITGVSPASQTYGALVANGPSKSMPFTFNISGTNGQNVAAVMQVHDGSGPTNVVLFNFQIGTTVNSFSNIFPIVINTYTNATPYPSQISVSGVGGQVGQMSVLITNLNHTWPDGIDMLLESPSGASTYLMSHCGGSYGVNNLTLTFSESASHSLTTTQLVSGTYLPSSFASSPPSFPVPAPPPVNASPSYYNTNLNVFTGSNPNGTWSLFIIDDQTLGSGVISNGWQLNLITTAAIVGASDVGITMTETSTNAVESNDLAYTITVFNYGPSTGSNVVVSDTLPTGAAFISAVPSQGFATNNAGILTWSVGNLSTNTGATLTLTVQPAIVGLITNAATVTASTADPNPADSSASVVTSVAEPSAQLVMTSIASVPNILQPPGQTQYVLSVTVTNQGPSPAAATLIQINLPPAVNPVGASSPAAWLLQSIVTNAVSGDFITFSNTGLFAVGASATVVLTNQVTSSGVFLNYADSSSAVLDPLKALSGLPPVKTVVLAPTNAPKFNRLTRSGASLVLNGSNGVPGWSFKILSSPSLTNPVANWTLVGTGVFAADGTLTLTNTINAAVRAQFYLIQEP